jgi:hypothetical protein
MNHVLQHAVSEEMSKHGTVVQPSRDQSLRSVSEVLERLVSHFSVETPFDVDLFMRQTYRVALLAKPQLHCMAAYAQLPARREIPIPDFECIYRYLKTIFDKLQLSTECAIIALIYIERLVGTNADVKFHARNWRTILLAALLTASKVWVRRVCVDTFYFLCLAVFQTLLMFLQDDLSSWNIEFSEIFPVFTLQDVNRLEVLFLERLKWNLAITGSEYARYYFSLRALQDSSSLRWEKDSKAPAPDVRKLDRQAIASQNKTDDSHYVAMSI